MRHHSRHTRATRADDGSYAFIYSASGQPFTVDLGKLAGRTISAYWYDPRTGTAHALGSFAAGTAPRTAARVDRIAQSFLPVCGSGRAGVAGFFDE